jgi:predicted nucleic acid-binding protein
VIFLDTSFLIDYSRNSRLVDYISEEEESVVSVISYHEIMAGLKRLRGKRELEFFENLFGEITIIPFDEESAVCSSDLASRLMLSGTPVNGFDILIAGSAVSRQASGILTADNDFQVIAPVADLPVISYDYTWTG